MEETFPPHVNSSFIGVVEKFAEIGHERPYRGETEGGEDDDDDQEKPKGVAEDEIAHGRLVDVPVELPHRAADEAWHHGGEYHEYQGGDQCRYPMRDRLEIKDKIGQETLDIICDLFRCGEEKTEPEHSNVEEGQGKIVRELALLQVDPLHISGC